MKSEVQRKAAEKPLGNSPKASNKKALNNLTVGGKGEKESGALSARWERHMQDLKEAPQSPYQR